MAKLAIVPTKVVDVEIDIFSNKSSLVLFWLMTHISALQSKGFSINELARDIGISVGQVYKVIKQLEYDGIISSKGLRTNKKFYFKNPSQLIVSWVKHYNLVRKTKTKGFVKVSPGLDLIQKKLDLVPALHTAASKVFNLKITNLRQNEFYLLNWEKLPKLIKELDLVELDRGYDVLIIKPYYTALLEKFNRDRDSDTWKSAFKLLTILDLTHFPIRGIEQAEALFKNSQFKVICPWREIENVIG